MLTSPVFPTIFVVGSDASAGDQLGEVDHAVQACVDHKAGDEAVRSAVAEGDEHDCDEGGDGVADVGPIDAGNLAHHEATDLL